MNMRISPPRRRTLGGGTSWLLLLAAGVASCSDSEPATPCFCTQEFRMFTVTVTDAAGQPAEGVSISVRRVSDAAVLTRDQRTSSSVKSAGCVRASDRP